MTMEYNLVEVDCADSEYTLVQRCPF